MTEPDGITDTTGPHATPEQEEFVAGLLAALGPDDIPMPDDVVARLDAVLAQERRTSTAAGSLVALTDATDAPRLPGLAPVTVLPAPRRGPSLRAFQWVGGLAAAALVVVGGVAVVGGGLGVRSATTSSSGSSASSADTGGGAVAETAASAPSVTVLSATGTAYTRSGLATQAAALVAVARTRAASGDFGPGSAEVPLSGVTDSAATPKAGTPTPTPATAYLARQSAGLSDCVEQLVGRPGTTALAVDAGTFDGKPADIVVLPSRDDPASLDVWVLAPGCTRAFADPLEFRRIPIP
jgi:hypothetical protein